MQLWLLFSLRGEKRKKKKENKNKKTTKPISTLVKIHDVILEQLSEMSGQHEFQLLLDLDLLFGSSWKTFRLTSPAVFGVVPESSSDLGEVIMANFVL